MLIFCLFFTFSLPSKAAGPAPVYPLVRIATYVTLPSGNIPILSSSDYVTGQISYQHRQDFYVWTEGYHNLSSSSRIGSISATYKTFSTDSWKNGTLWVWLTPAGTYIVTDSHTASSSAKVYFPASYYSTHNGGLSFSIPSDKARTVSFGLNIYLPEQTGYKDGAYSCRIPLSRPFFSLPSDGITMDISPSVYMRTGSVSNVQSYLRQYTGECTEIYCSFDAKGIDPEFPYVYIFFTVTVPDSVSFSGISATEFTRGLGYCSYTPSSSSTIITDLESAGGHNSGLNSSNQEVSNTFDQYESVTDTTDIYNKIDDSFFNFNTAPFIQIAPTITLFTSCITMLYNGLGDLAVPLTMFLVSMFVSFVIGIFRNTGGGG